MHNNQILSSFVCLLFSLLSHAFAQAPCPPNIGFEAGNFTGWAAYRGVTTATAVANLINVNSTTPQSRYHSITSASTPKDKYGGFSALSPNGSKYAVKLGNDQIGAEAERISYEFIVPVDQAEYSLTYYYAVVFEDPNHPTIEQPRFQVRVFDIDANSYINCASFEFIATSNLPGFKSSPVKTGVLYKDWSPVTIDLSGYSGKKMRIEFTTADCTRTGHFGYAYLDIDEICTTPITGNIICENATSVTLKGPSGYQSYTWYTSDFSQQVGTGEQITISPAPSSTTKFALRVIPYPGFGCPDDLFTTIATINFQLKLTNINACFPDVVDLTSSSVTSGSTPGMVFSYWRDPGGNLPLANPDKISQSGTYYIKGVVPEGCSEIKAISVTINESPNLFIRDPAPACAPGTVDLTSASIITGSSAGLTYSYWLNEAGTIPLPNPSAIAQSGTYYIRGMNSSGCFKILPVKVELGTLPLLVTKDPAAVCLPQKADLTSASLTVGSSPGLTFTYWKDVLATIPVSVANAVDQSGSYYIKATNSMGCSQIQMVNVVVYPLPELVVTDPPRICEPFTADLTSPAITAGSSPQLILTYWKDVTATIPVTVPQSVGESGIYYIKATNLNGCFVIKQVTVSNNVPPDLLITNPPPSCPPFGVDITSPAITLGSSSGIQLTYWLDASATVAVSNPKNVTSAATYYIKAMNDLGCSTVKPVVVGFNKPPELILNNPAEVCVPQTIDLTVPGITAGSTPGLTFTYWKDASAMVPVEVANTITESGTYFVKGTNSLGCSVIRPVIVAINKYPELKIFDPAPVCSSDFVDLTNPAITMGSTAQVTLSYWENFEGTIELSSPQLVKKSGRYYIRSTNSSGCSVIKAVIVSILPEPSFTLKKPPVKYDNQTINLTTDQVITGEAGITYTYWQDMYGRIKIPDPNRVSISGTYYIQGTNSFGCSIIKSVDVELVPYPVIAVPTAFTPTQNTNNKLYPFIPGIKTLIAFKVFNRLGNLVFESNDPSAEKGWDGYYNGSLHFFETYTWYAEGIDGLGKIIRSRGNTILLK